MINIAIKLATSITYTADGSQTNFSVPFDYLRPAFVHVSVNDAEVSEGFTISNRMVMFDSAPAKDAVVHIYRNTPTTRLVSWADASILKAIDMTIAEVQQLHILEEANDWSKTHSIVFDEERGVWQGRNYRVSNVSDPTEAQDVVTKNYLENTEDSFVQRMNAIKTQTEQFANTAGNSKDSAYKSAQSASVSAASAAESAKLAEGYKNIAETAKSDASLYAANAKTSADNAGASKEAAQSAATTASNFASAARNSANEAQTYRNNAKTYMDNAKNYSENVNVFVPSVSTEGVLSWTNKAGLTNPKSVNIKGAKGDTGTAASIKIGSVTTGAAGSNASVVNRGDANNAILDFVLPKGTDGKGSVITVNGKEPDAGGNVNVANMAGASDSAAGKAGLVPIPTAGKQDMALCGDATFKVLPIAGGGTGANTISAACKALGLDWDWFHRYGLNYVPPDVTNNGWNSLGLCLIYYTEVKIKNQPTTYGQLLNIPANQDVESTQIWIEQSSGDLYFRGGNGSNIVNDEVFTRVATEEDVSSAGYGIVAANLAQNGYVKFANGLILQWGYNSKGAVSFPLTFSMLFTPLVTPQQKIGSIGGSYFYFSMLTNSGFSLAYGEIPIYWIAIGR